MPAFADLVDEVGVVLDGLGFFYDLSAGAFGGEFLFGDKVFEAENEVYFALRVETAARHVFTGSETRNDFFPVAENVGFYAC